MEARVLYFVHLQGFDSERFKALSFVSPDFDTHRIRDGWRAALAVSQHGHVDVFENLAGGDAENAIERFDQIVAPSAAMLTSEMVDETESGAELLGLD